MSDLAVIDIAPLFLRERGAWGEVDDRIGSAIERHGGFVCTGYPDAESVDRWAATMLRFFTIDQDAKHSVASRSTWPSGPRVYRGYRSSLEPGGWAYNEMFDIGPAVPFAAPAPGMEVFAEPNVWPDPTPAPGWRRAMQSYYTLMLDVGTRVMRSAGRWAGFTDEDLEQRFRQGNSTLRLLNYPAKPEGLAVRPDASVEDGGATVTLAAVRHTDASGLSLLWQQQPGLQAQAPDGTWRDVPMVANTVSVHLGTVLELMTAGRVPATPHRVIDHGTDRQSIGFFVEPGLGTRLAPIAEGDAAPGELSGTYGWHLQERFHAMRGFEDLVPAPG